MGLASLIAGMAGAAAGAVSSAMSSNKKPSSSTSSGSSSSSNSSGSSNSSSRPSSGSSSGSSSSSSSSSTGFDKNTDYQAQINNAVSKGDYTLAAQLEQKRNDKINAGYGGNNTTTNLYSQYLPGNSSSGSSATGAGSSGGTYKPLGVYNDADLQKVNPQAYQLIQQYKNQYSEAAKLGDTDGMNKAHDLAEQIRDKYGYSGGGDGSQFLPNGMGSTIVDIVDMANQKAQYDQIIADLQNAAAQQQQNQQQQLDNINAQYEAILGQMQSNLEAQKEDAAKQTALNNAAAEKAYMTAIKPNGSLAENLAANGLLSSGLTETSQIQAGNTYQNALNNNTTTQTELIAELERMAAQAEYTNDLERLQAIQQVMAQIAETGYASAKDIASLRQWSVENSQNYNTQQKQLEMQRQQIQEDLANGKIDRQTAEKQLEYLNAQIEEIQLTNKYNKYQLGQLGIS